jgi:hypothetical protein
MQPKRPGSVLTLAILNLVYGGLGLMVMLCSASSLVMMVAMKGMGAGPFNPVPNQLEFMNQEIPGYTALMIGTVVMELVVSVGFLMAGVGLLRTAAWAWWASLVCGVVVLVWEIPSTAYTIRYVNPAQVKMQALTMEHVKKMQPKGATPVATPEIPMLQDVSFYNGMSIGLAVLISAYPLALLALLFLPSVRAACAGRGLPPPVQPEDYHD